MIRYALALLILAGTAVGHLGIERAQVQAARNKTAESHVLSGLPAEIGPYTQDGPDFEISDYVKRVLQSSEILQRRYRSSEGWPIDVTIVYAGTTRRSLHFPEVCLVGQGFEIRNQGTRPIGFDFVAKSLVLVKGNQQQAVLYWFKTGDYFTGNFFANSWYWAKNQLSFGAPTSAMIKIEAPIGRRTEEQVFQVLEDFALKFTPILSEYVP